MDYNFDEPFCPRDICSQKWDWDTFNALYYGQETPQTLLYPREEYINLGIADMDFPVAKPILDALHERIEKRCLGYTYSFDGRYREIVSNWMKRRYQWTIRPEQTSVSAGVLVGLEKAISMTVPKGSKILLLTPVYSPFQMVIDGADCKTETTSLINKDGDYTVDWEDFKRKVADSEVKAFLLCNPQNPVGRVWSEEELRRMGELCFQHDVFVFSDEIHCDFIRPEQKFTPFGKVFPDEKKWFSAMSCGKTFNLSGLPYANVVIPDKELRTKWENAVGVLCANVLSMTAYEVALTVCDDWLDQLRQYIDENFIYLKRFVDQYLPEAGFQIPEGTYFAWIDLSKYAAVLNNGNWHDFFLEKAAVELDGGGGFIGGDSGFVRLMLGCTHERLKTAMERMRQVIYG